MLLGLCACPAPDLPPPPASIPMPAIVEAARAMEPAPEPPPPDWLGAFRHEYRYEPKSRSLMVELTIADGFHAYTLGETIGKPLQLTFSADSAHDVEGEVEYPVGMARDLPIGRSVIVEGRATIKARLKRRSGAAGPAKGVLSYQVCTDEACDRPRTHAFTVPVAP